MATNARAEPAGKCQQPAHLKTFKQGKRYRSWYKEDTVRKLIISLTAAAAITAGAAAAAPAITRPAPAHAPAHVTASIWRPGGCGSCRA